MLSLKSNKVSLGVLIALVSIDWYVGMQAPDTNAFGMNNFPGSGTGISKSLPTLRIVQLPPSLVSGKLFNFTAPENASTFQELQSSLAFTVPLQLARLASPEPAQEKSIFPMNVEAQIQQANVDVESKDPAISSTQPQTSAHTKPKADTPQAANLIKLLALYSMLHR